MTPNETVARNVVLSSSYHRLLSRLGLAQRNRRPRPRPVLGLPSVLAPFPSALCFPPSHLSVYLHLGLTSLHIAAIETTPPPCTIHCCWILFSTMKTREIPRVLPLPALTLCMSRRAIYTCPARLHFWLGGFKTSLQTNGAQGWTFDQDDPPAQPPQPPSRKPRRPRVEDGGSNGRKSRSRPANESSHSTTGCECEFYAKFKFSQRSIT